jgi:hypothetical protein
MKEMLNWDLFTHPKADSFARNTSNKEKVDLPYNGKILWILKKYSFPSMNGKIRKQNFQKLLKKDPNSTKGKSYMLSCSDSFYFRSWKRDR